jgi:hypothetical protein
MPNGAEHKEFGGHHYPAAPDATSDCSHGCGCWAGPARSGGPPGLDPFGKCPNNPVDGVRREGKDDYAQVVNDRIRDLESRLYRAEHKLKQVEPDKLELAERLEKAEAELRRRDKLWVKVVELVHEVV